MASPIPTLEPVLAVMWLTAGNQPGPQLDYLTVKCARYREAASARLDNEPLGLSASALAEHLSRCAGCAAWLESATRIGRSLRLSGDAPPDLSAQILQRTVLPAGRVARYRRRLRVALAVLGLVQWALAMPALFGQQMYTQMSMHASHESAAWNLAVGAAFLAVAVKPVRAAGTVSLLATFVVVLTILSIPDLADGAVDAGRLFSHAAVVLGLILVLLMQRNQRLLPQSGVPETSPATDADELGARRRDTGAA